jgi:polysaccharide pyruvyl transferase WcaK-like protein
MDNSIGRWLPSHTHPFQMSALTQSNLDLVATESIASSIGSVLHGLYIGAAAFSLYLLASGGKESSSFSSGRRFLFAVITIMLLFDMMNTASSIYLVVHDIHSFGGSFHPKATRALEAADATLSMLNVRAPNSFRFLCKRNLSYPTNVTSVFPK